MDEQKQGIADFKRSGVVGLFLWFLMNSDTSPASVIYTGAVVTIVYMILDGIKHAKGKK